MNVQSTFSIHLLIHFYNVTMSFIQCVRKTETKCFSCNISYKTWAILIKFGTSFRNKFAAKSCKRFPPHLNNVSTLPCET